jgi:hypothetical protein
MKDASAVVALISAIVAIIVTVFTALQAKKARDDKKVELKNAAERWLEEFNAKRAELESGEKRWLEEFNAKRAELESGEKRWLEEFNAKRAELESEEARWTAEFNFKQSQTRLDSYAEVFKVLGVVSDVAVSADRAKARATLYDDRKLQDAADDLLDHLYGRAGLLMSMPVRNELLYAWAMCKSYLDGDGSDASLQRLVDAFFSARRFLRADLDLIDNRAPNDLAEQLGTLDRHARAKVAGSSRDR